MAAIIAIDDRRGRKEPDESKLKQIAAKLKARDGRAPSIRQIAERARREGLRVSRDRLTRMFPPAPKPEISARIRERRFVDLSMVYFAPGLTVLGFVSNDAECLRALDPGNKGGAMLPPTLTSGDRARVLECARLAALMKLKYGERAAPDWDDLLNLVHRMPKEGQRLFYIVSDSKMIPRRVESALRGIAAKLPTRIRRVKSPNLAFRRMLSPRLASLGAGYFPTLGDTVRRLADLVGQRYKPISLCQAPEVRDKAMKLRVSLEKRLQSLGVHVSVGYIKVKQLLSRSDLSANEPHARPALVAPWPVDFSLIRISQKESPKDSNLIPLSFRGVEEVLARLSHDKLRARTKRIFELQDQYMNQHANEDMLACASFFSGPKDNFLGTDFFQILGPLHKVSHEAKMFYSVLLLLCYDPDTLLPPKDIGADAKRDRFAAAYSTFMREAAAHVDKCLGSLSLASLRKHDPKLDEDELDDMRGALKLAMLGRLMRVWKSGLDEATRRMTMAVFKIAQDRRLMSEMIGKIEAVQQTRHPADAIGMLSEISTLFAGIWPTVAVSRRHLRNFIRVHAKWMAKQHARQRLGKKVIPGVNTEALISDRERTAGFSGRLEDKATPEVTAAPPPESVEELLAERLESATPLLNEEEVMDWWLRLLTALRRCAERKERVRLGVLTAMFPRCIGKLLNSTADEFKRNGWKNFSGKKLHQELEAFFAAHVQSAGG